MIKADHSHGRRDKEPRVRHNSQHNIRAPALACKTILHPRSPGRRPHRLEHHLLEKSRLQSHRPRRAQTSTCACCTSSGKGRGRTMCWIRIPRTTSMCIRSGLGRLGIGGSIIIWTPNILRIRHRSGRRFYFRRGRRGRWSELVMWTFTMTDCFSPAVLAQHSLPHTRKPSLSPHIAPRY